jgi:hypothetical protein
VYFLDELLNEWRERSADVQMALRKRDQYVRANDQDKIRILDAKLAGYVTEERDARADVESVVVELGLNAITHNGEVLLVTRRAGEIELEWISGQASGNIKLPSRFRQDDRAERFMGVPV